MSTAPSTAARPAASEDSAATSPSDDHPTPSQLAARAKLVEVRAEVASMHDEMAKLKTDLAQMTQTYMQEMQALLMETLTHAMEQQAAIDDQGVKGDEATVQKK